jgi:hypothetical protein
LISSGNRFTLWVGYFMKIFTSLVASVAFATVLFCCGRAAGQGAFSGKVAETMDAGGYTYVLVDTGTNKIWAAAPQFQVKNGDQVAVPDAMPMSGFHSPTLNRDFDVIYFAGSIPVNGTNSSAAALPPGHPAIGGSTGGVIPPNHPAVAGEIAPAKIDFTGLKPAKGGKTIAEIYAASATLAGKPVTVRGKVVKYNSEIMGRNWIHIQDGTGDAESNDLLVTSTAEAKPGDTVLVEGTVNTNKDFGAGYKYTVLLEDAKVTVE